jgi:nucleotide-binding universal stress UspA family protein
MGNLATLGGTIGAATLTSLATIIIFLERFTEGAWTYFVFLPLLYLLFSYFRRRLGDPIPANERHGLRRAGQRYLPVSELGYEFSKQNFNNILIPLDGSEFAEEAIPLARAVSSMGDNNLTLVSVIQTSGTPRAIPLVPNNLDGDHRAHERYLEDMTIRLDGLGFKTQYLVGRGSIPEEIVTAARDRQANLVVMSTHGRSGFGRLLVGSVASQVIRTSSLPVLMVKPGTWGQSHSHSFEKLLVALDGSTAAEQVLPFTQIMATHFQSEILLLSVPDDLLGENQHDNLNRYLTDVAEWFEKDGLVVRTNVTGSTPAHTIVGFADSHAVDLIMLATRGLGGRDRLMFGSVADTVIRNTSKPVFLVPIHPT